MHAHAGGSSLVRPFTGGIPPSLCYPHQRHRKHSDLPGKVEAGPQDLLAAVSQLQASLSHVRSASDACLRLLLNAAGQCRIRLGIDQLSPTSLLPGLHGGSRLWPPCESCMCCIAICIHNSPMHSNHNLLAFCISSTPAASHA